MERFLKRAQFFVDHYLSDWFFFSANIVLLIILMMIILSYTKNKFSRIIVALLASITLVLQISSLYFVSSFIGYKFFVHFNTRDIIAMMNMFIYDGLLLFITFFILVFFFYKFKIKEKFFGNSLGNLIKISLLILSVGVMSLEKGIIDSSLGLVSMFNLHIDKTSFDQSLKELEIADYTTPENLQVFDSEKKKNVILISLESLEKGYLSDKFVHLTPNLDSLRRQWTYMEMNQNKGSDWTSGSLYTCLTGLPAFFGISGNSIFETAYHSNITSISHVFEKAGYEMTYLVSDAQFSGTQQMLNTFHVNNIIDETLLGEEFSKDKDLFEKAKQIVDENASQRKPFALFISTLDTHFPDGKYDERMEKYIPQQNSNLEFMVSAVDYMIKDFIKYLQEEDILSNTVIYIFPDHLKMGSSDMFEGTGERGLYILTNSTSTSLNNLNRDNLYQIDLPRIILDGADISHNAKFLSDFVSIDKNLFIKNNAHSLVNLNSTGILRLDSEDFMPKVISKNYAEYKNNINRFIAHAGGMIDSLKYTNSLEALNENYRKGFRIFELDIIKTSDGKFIAAHDWQNWATITNYSGDTPVSNYEFLNQKIYNKYTPLDMVGINKWFDEHKDAILVTDKVNEPKAFSEIFIDKNRLMMELFTLDAVKEGIDAKIKSSIPSQKVIEKLNGDKVNKLKQLGVTHIAVSRRYIAKNADFLINLKKNGIKAYVYHVNFDPFIDEDYVVKYEMDIIYGIYADKWEFNH